MSLAVWLGAVRKCSAAVVGLDLVLGLSMVRRSWSIHSRDNRGLILTVMSTDSHSNMLISVALILNKLCFLVVFMVIGHSFLLYLHLQCI